MDRPQPATRQTFLDTHPNLPRRCFGTFTTASSWEEIWEAGPYYDRISELMEDAQESIFLVGWQIDSRLRFLNPFDGNRREALKHKLVRLCNEKPDLHVYLLMWDHAYFYSFERERMQGQIWENAHPRIHFVFDNRHPYGGSHHEKLILIDGRVGFAGGIDLCDERWDSGQHLFRDPRRSLSLQGEHHGPYHDTGVQVTGPVCATIHRHIAARWKALSNIPLPPEPSERLNRIHGGHGVYLSRTISRTDVEEGLFPITREVEFLYKELIARTQWRLILEGQYYWSERISDAIIAHCRRMRGRPFEIYIVLAELAELRSLSKQMAFWELRLLEKLEAAARENGIKLVMGRPYVGSSDSAASRPIYVHSKVIVSDDRYLSIGSANLAARAFRLDTELNLTLEARTEAEQAHIRRVGDRILTHWNLIPPLHDSGLFLKPFHPSEELRQIHARSPVLSRIPWQRFFDPETPWFYFIKRRYRLAARRRKHLILGVSAFLIWCAGFGAVSWLGFRQGYALTASAYGYVALLSSVWLLPVPFLLTALGASIQFPTMGPALAVDSLWVASIWGYALARSVPTTTRRLFERTAPLPLRKLPGTRTFSGLLRVALNPWIGVHEIILYQGLNWSPLPWFAFTSGLILPSILYVLCRLVAGFSPQAVSNTLGRHAAAYMAILWLISLLRFRRNGGK